MKYHSCIVSRNVKIRQNRVDLKRICVEIYVIFKQNSGILFRINYANSSVSGHLNKLGVKVNFQSEEADAFSSLRRLERSVGRTLQRVLKKVE